MKSIKPGRSNSAVGIIGSIFGVCFSIFWIHMVLKMNNPMFALFGVFFLVMTCVGLFINIKNTFSKNRYSIYDITDEHEEIDPLQKRFYEAKETKVHTFGYCPYCGEELEQDYKYCPKCGREIDRR